MFLSSNSDIIGNISLDLTPSVPLSFLLSGIVSRQLASSRLSCRIVRRYVSAMVVGDLKTEQGMKSLDAYLADKSYVEGYQPTQADVSVFECLGEAPGAATPHALRWYNHIASYGDARTQLPGEKKLPNVFSGSLANGAGAPAKPHGQARNQLAGKKKSPKASSRSAASRAKEDDDDDDDVDLFASDDEDDAEAAKIREERLKVYAEKKSKKPALIAKSSIVLDVKPWDDNTDMKEMEAKVRSITMDGLVWGASKLAPVGYGINKLQIMCVVEDEKVSIDLLSEEIQEFEDYVQSVDVASFNKI